MRGKSGESGQAPVLDGSSFIILRAFKRATVPRYLSAIFPIFPVFVKRTLFGQFLFSYLVKMASNPPGACCASGFKHEGNPAGEIKTVEGGK